MMAKEKEIEEMARIIHGTPFSDMHRAVALYNAGYRKKSEVAKEIFEDIEKLKLTKFDWQDYVDWEGISELKKKYTGE